MAYGFVIEQWVGFTIGMDKKNICKIFKRFVL